MAKTPRLSRRQFLEMAGTAALGCTVGCTPAPSPQVDFLSPDLDELIRVRLARDHVPGFATCIVRGERLLWSGGYGFANIGAQIAMTPRTLQNIGSISKTITATAVMQLWEVQELALDDDVNDYLPFVIRNPRFPESPITFRQLLTHRSSIKDGPAYGASYACGDPAVSLADWVSGYFTPDGPYYNAEENFHLWEPGTADPPPRPRAYSNVGYGLLGYLVENIVSLPFSTYCQEEIFAPLGMPETAWYLADLDIARHAVPYSFIAEDFEMPDESEFDSMLPAPGLTPADLRPGTHAPHCLYSFYNYPDGLVRTSVLELSRFLRAYILGGELEGRRILRRETIDTMLSFDHYGRGLCWSPREMDNGDLLWGHGGGDPGISTYMGFRPTDGIGVIVFFNCGSPGEGANEIFERLLQETDQNP
jgi:CubicO group peptidase (beta-lactamase class C family)